MVQALLDRNLFQDSATFIIEHPKGLNNSGGQIKDYVLFVGKNSAPFCSQIVSFHLSGLSFNSIRKAQEWLVHRYANNQALPYSIICDDHIEGEDIFSVVKQMKKNNYLRNIPIIFLTTGKTLKFRQKVLEARVDDYYLLSKFNLETLMERLKFLHSMRNFKVQYPTSPRESSKKVQMWLFKRPFDLIIAITSIFFLSPVLILVALLIKLDSKGPVLYISKRAGSGYKVFDFYKFRTMKVNADKELDKLSERNQYSAVKKEKSDSLFVKIKDDPRVTKLGRFLRKTSLDELPQLINVMKGDMSIVGNRPLPLYEATKLTTDQWAQRFLAPAGITGLWQITKRGRDNMSEQERIELDCSYASHNSFLYDLRIILLTFPALLQKENV